MKRSPLLLALLAVLPVRLPAEMSLQAVACTLPFAHFALSDSISGDRGWISLGDDFSGFTARAYDPVSETLTLGRDSHTIRLSLGRASPPTTPEPFPESAVSPGSIDLEHAYWLATARDQQSGGFLQRLGGAIKTSVVTARELTAAESAYAKDPNHENARRQSDAKRHWDREMAPEIFLWTRAAEPTAAR